MEKIEKMKLYVASGWNFRKDVQKINDRLRSENFDIISTWIECENGISSPTAYTIDAVRDTTEITNCDILLAIMSDKEYAYRGTFTEIGYAIGIKKPILIVCPGISDVQKISEIKYNYSYSCMTNVFFWHTDCNHVPDLEEAIKKIHYFKLSGNLK